MTHRKGLPTFVLFLVVFIVNASLRAQHVGTETSTGAAQDTTVFVDLDPYASSTMNGSSCESVDTFDPAYSMEEVGAYYWNLDETYISRGILSFNTANAIPDTDAVVDSMWLVYYTTSVSGPDAQLFFMAPDSLLPAGYVPTADPSLWSFFDTTASPSPAQGLSENGGPYHQPIDPEVLNTKGYTVIGIRIAQDYQDCGQKSESQFVYVAASSGKLPRLGIKYHKRKPQQQCCLTTRIDPPEAAQDGCQVLPSRVEGECGSQVTISAVEADGWNFTHWSGAASGTNSSATVTLSSQSPNCDEAVAHFVRPELTVSASGNEIHLCPCCTDGRTHIIATINLCANDVDDWVVHKIKLAARGTGHDVADLVQERLYDGEEKIATFWFSKDDDLVEIGVNRRVPKGGCLTLRVEYVFRDTISMADVDTFKTFFVETHTDWVSAEPLNYNRYAILPVGGEWRVGPGLVAPVWNVTRDRPFMKIQAAVDDAATQPGDTIGVCPGEIQENAVVAGKERLVIRGTEFGKTSLVKGADPHKPVLDIRSDSTTVQFLTLQQSNLVSPGLLARNVRGVRAEYLEMSHTKAGIHFANVDGGAIYGCVAVSNVYGVQLDSCRNVAVGDTTAGTWGNRGNVLRQNVRAGIYANRSERCSILGNIALNNSGTDETAGIYLDFCSDLEITRNLSSNNEYSGIYLRDVANSRVRKNLLGVDEQGRNALPNANGMVVVDCSELTIASNVMSGNKERGLYLEAIGVGGNQRIVIEKNRVGVSADGLQAIPNGTKGIVLYSEAHDVLIRNNVVAGNRQKGVVLRGVVSGGEAIDMPEDVTITNNLIGLAADGRTALPMKEVGIAVYVAKNITIGPGNVIGACGFLDFRRRWRKGATYGGIVVRKYGSGVTIQNNRIGLAAGSDEPVPNRVGIWLEANNSSVAGNTIAYSKDDGVYLDRGKRIRIENNEIRDNHSNGILVYKAEDVIIRGNHVHDNRMAGTALELSLQTKVIGNLFERNCPGASSVQCGVGTEFIGNTYRENCHETGIHLDGGAPRIVGNRILRDSGDGVFTENGARPVLRDNWIAENQGFGLRNLDPTTTVDARQNWWGDASGPGGAGSGSGDEVSDGVDYQNWLAAAPGLIAAAAPETLLVPAGGGDSLTCSVQNWQKPDDAVRYGVRVDSARWCQSDTVGTVQLKGEMGGAFTLRFQVPEGSTSGSLSRAEIVLTSSASPDLRDTLHVLVATYAPGTVGIRVLPEEAYLTPGASATFAAVGFDRAGRPQPAAVQWTTTCGAIDSTGRYTAPDSTCSGVVVAFEPETGFRDTARVYIVPSIDSLAISPREATVQSGGQQQFRATGYDSAGNAVTVDVEWFARGGNISASGLYTAGAVRDTVRYWVAALYPATGHSDTAWVTVTPAPTEVEESPATEPLEFALYQNYPNPFNPVTTIAFTVRERCRVTLKIYDLLGREVATLVDGVKEPGRYRVNFRAEGLASGVYVAAIQMGSFRATRKVVLLR